MTGHLPLVGYLRVSDMGERDADDPSFQSTRLQRRNCEAIATLTPGAEIVEWIEDLDKSGGTMDRPGVKRAIELVESGQAKGIVVAYLDRWARTVQALEMIERWAGEGKLFISAHERFDATTPHGKFALGMMLLVAKYYRDMATENWTSACRDAIERGVHTTIPYGYRRGEKPKGHSRAHAKGGDRGASLVIVDEEARIVRRIFDERHQGVGLAAIAEGLNADGIPSPRGGLWTRQAILAMLRVKTYKGDAHRGGVATADAHDAIVSPDKWDEAQQTKGPARQNNKSLLVGLARCAGCGYIMGAGSTRQSRRYNCVRHHSEMHCPLPTTAPAEKLEGLVTDMFLDEYGTESLASGRAADPVVTSTKAALTRAQSDYRAWRDDSDMRAELGDAEYRAGLLARRETVGQRESAHAEAVRRSDASTLTVARDVWETLTLPEKRVIMRKGIDAVVLRRAVSTHEPLADRVKVLWTGELDHDGSRRGIAIAVRANGNP